MMGSRREGLRVRGGWKHSERVRKRVRGRVSLEALSVDERKRVEREQNEEGVEEVEEEGWRKRGKRKRRRKKRGHHFFCGVESFCIPLILFSSSDTKSSVGLSQSTSSSLTLLPRSMSHGMSSSSSTSISSSGMASSSQS